MQNDKIKLIKKWFRKARKWFTRPPDRADPTSDNFYMRMIAAQWREVRLYDISIFVLIIAQFGNLAFVYGKGDPNWNDYFRALGISLIEGRVGVMAGRAGVLKQKKLQAFYWIAFIVVLSFTVPIHLTYDVVNHYQMEYGRLVMSERLLQDLDYVVVFLGVIGSGIMGIVILLAGFMRYSQEAYVMKLQEDFVKYKEDQNRREKKRIENQRYRKNKEIKQRVSSRSKRGGKK